MAARALTALTRPDQPVSQLGSPSGLNGALVAMPGGLAMVGQGPSIVEPVVAPSPLAYTDAEMKEIDVKDTTVNDH